MQAEDLGSFETNHEPLKGLLMHREVASLDAKLPISRVAEHILHVLRFIRCVVSVLVLLVPTLG